MTRRTGDLLVAAFQRVIYTVIEIVPIEDSQRRVSAFVLGMTLRARRGAHARIFSVVADSLQDLFVDRLVTRPAQLRLALLVKCDVTIPAIIARFSCFLFRSPGDIMRSKMSAAPACCAKNAAKTRNAARKFRLKATSPRFSRDERRRHESWRRQSAETAMAHAARAITQTCVHRIETPRRAASGPGRPRRTVAQAPAAL